MGSGGAICISWMKFTEEYQYRKMKLKRRHRFLRIFYFQELMCIIAALIFFHCKKAASAFLRFGSKERNRGFSAHTKMRSFNYTDRK
jgi:hypothetical protein